MSITDNPRFTTRDYTITDRCVLDIVIPANFLGIRTSLGRILLRAVSEVGTTDFMRYQFLVLPVDTETSEHIAYDLDHGWSLLGILGSRTVYYRQLYE